MANTSPKRSPVTLRHLMVPCALTVSISTWSCGGADNNKDTTDDQTTTTSVGGGTTSQTLSVDIPADSTGGSGTASLGFALASSDLGLALTTAASLDLGSGIVLSEARVNIGAIKLKANKDRTADEKAMLRQQRLDMKASEAQMESDKKALEQSKEALESTYEQEKAAATTDAERAAARTKLITGLVGLEERKAALHAAKEAAQAEKEAAADGNMRWKGPYVYDLISETITPAVASVSIPDGSYKRIEFKLRANRTADASDALLNKSVYLAGTVTISGVATPFTVSLESDEQVMLNTTDAFKIESGVANALIVGLTPANWFTGVDLSSASKNTDGTIELSPGSNTPLLEMIKKNIKAKTKFGKDKDGDGKVSDSEVKGDGQDGANAVSEDEAA